MQNASERRTPLQRTLDQFGQKLSIAILVISAIVVAIGALVVMADIRFSLAWLERFSFFTGQSIKNTSKNPVNTKKHPQHRTVIRVFAERSWQNV
jgi:magnesium-transporting ATPase (P-type)